MVVDASVVLELITNSQKSPIQVCFKRARWDKAGVRAMAQRKMVFTTRDPH